MIAISSSFRRRGRLVLGAAALLVLAAVAAALAGCGSGSTATVEFSGLELHPQVVTVPAGASITWTNNDPEPHTVTSDKAKVPATALKGSPQPDVVDSGPIEPGASYSFTFSTPGTYKYADLIDGYITGTVIVR